MSGCLSVSSRVAGLCVVCVCVVQVLHVISSVAACSSTPDRLTVSVATAVLCCAVMHVRVSNN